MRAFENGFVLTCPDGAAACHARMREVLDRIELPRPSWPSLDEWAAELPVWFVQACANPSSLEEVQARTQRRQHMSPAELAQSIAQQRWSLPGWLYWMEPAQSEWTWVRAHERSATELVVTLGVDGHPCPVGAFEWLARIAGATRVDEA